MLQITRLLAAAAAALCNVHAAGADIDALMRTTWVQASSEHFRVVTDLDASTATLLANDLEHMRHFSSRVLGIDTLDAVGPLTVLAVGDASLFAKIGLAPTYAGVFSTTLRGFAALANVKDYVGDGYTSRPARQTLLHEYEHFLVRMTQNTVLYPKWCSEGMAEYFSTFRYDKTSVSVGNIDPDLHVNRVRSMYGKKGLFAMDSAGVFNTTELNFNTTTAVGKRALESFYARAGYAIHFFNSSLELRTKFANYLRLYNMGIDQDRAAQLAFKRSYADLDNDMWIYLDSAPKVRVFKATEGPFTFPQVQVRVEPLEPPRVATVLAQVLTLVPVPPEARNAAVARNLELNPASAHAMIDAMRFRAKGMSKAELRTLLQRFPDNAELLSIDADTMRADAEGLRALGLPGWQPLLLKARDQFRRAVQADRGYPFSYYGLGKLYMMLPEGEAVDEGIAGLDSASVYHPSADVFGGLAALALRAGRQDEAIQALRHAVTVSPPDSQTSDALLLDNLEMVHEVLRGTASTTSNGLAYRSGMRYVGQVKGLKPHGEGKLTRVNDSYIEGRFADGLPLTGKLESTRGGRYEGQFTAGVAAGQGRLTLAEASYEGGIALGKPSGQGILTNAAGRYEGAFLDGQPHGAGNFTPAAKDGAIRGTWRYGRYLWPANAGEQFAGAIDANGQPTGAGYCYVSATNTLRDCRRGADSGNPTASTQ